MENVELTAVASPTEQHRQKFMKLFDVPHGFADWRDMLQCDLDLVCVTTPTSLHREMVTGVLESGKSVLCEKPFALNVTDAEAMVKVADNSSGLALIDHQLRFHPAVRQMKQMIDGGELGKVYEVRAVVNLASRNKLDMPWS
jgi:predicted dehydrogenase